MAQPLPRSPARARMRGAILLAAAALLGACDGIASERAAPGPGDELDHIVEQNAELVARIDELEHRLERLTGDRDAVDVAALIDDLDQVERIADQLAEERDARLAFAHRVEELERDLRASIVDLRDDLQALRGLIDDLEVRYEVLRQRVDRLG